MPVIACFLLLTYHQVLKYDTFYNYHVYILLIFTPQHIVFTTQPHNLLQFLMDVVMVDNIEIVCSIGKGSLHSNVVLAFLSMVQSYESPRACRQIHW